MPGFPQEWFLSISFFFFPINGAYIPDYCWYTMQFFKLKIRYFEYCYVVILETIFSLLPRVWHGNLLRTTVITLFSDFSKLFLQRLYSSLCAIIEVSALLSKQPSSDLRDFLKCWRQKEWKNKTKQNPALLVFVDWLWARAFFWCLARFSYNSTLTFTSFLHEAQLYKPTQVFSKYVSGLSITLDSPGSSPSKLLFPEMSLSSASSFRGFSVCLLLVPSALSWPNGYRWYMPLNFFSRWHLERYFSLRWVKQKASLCAGSSGN